MPIAPRARSLRAMFKTRLGIRQPLIFAAIGVLSTFAYALIYAALRETASAHVSNLLALAITALANTGANRHFTFGVRGRAGLVADHLGGLAAFGVALAISSASIGLLQLTVPTPGVALEIAVLGLGNVIAAITRFVLLRLWLERHRRLILNTRDRGR
jgi:putative flippase GtrA